MPQISANKLDNNQLEKYELEVNELTQKLDKIKSDIITQISTSSTNSEVKTLTNNSKQVNFELKLAKLKLQKLKFKNINTSSYNKFLEKIQLDKLIRFNTEEIIDLDNKSKDLRSREENINRNYDDINLKLENQINNLESFYSNCSKITLESKNLIEEINQTENKLNELRNTPASDLKTELASITKSKDTIEKQLKQTQLKHKNLSESYNQLQEKLSRKTSRVEYFREKIVELQGSTGGNLDSPINEDIQEDLQKLCPWLENSINFLQSIVDEELEE